jgi:VanZ family protein
MTRSEEEVEFGTRVRRHADARGADRVRRGRRRRRPALLSAAARYLPPLALMALIFALSAQPNLSSGLGAWDLVLRKLAHMVAFGLLWALWQRALRRPAAAALITLLYAASDELHQSGVEGRNGSPWDWAIDAAGVALAVLAWRRYSQPRSVA